MNCKLNFTVMLVLFTLASAFSQSKKLYFAPHYRYSLDVNTTYYRGFNTITYDDLSSDRGSDNTVGSIVDYFDLGVQFNYYLTSRIALVTGVKYSNPGFIASTETALKRKSSGTEVIPMLSISSGATLRRNYFSLPTLVRINVSGVKKCKSYLELGFSHQAYANTNVRQGEEKYHFTEDQQRYNVAAVANMGAEFFITDVIKIFTQLNLNYQLTQMEQVNLKDRHSAIGVSTGIRFTL